MAVYQGARPRGFTTGALPAPASRPIAGLPGRARPRPRSAVRPGSRRLTVGAMLGGIVLVFVVGFFSLIQGVRVTAANYEVDRLTLQRERLQARQRELQSDINRLGSEPAIRKLAFDAGLGQLDAPIVLPAR